MKAAGDATVYYNKEGKLYHMQSSCKKMNSAKPHTLAEAIADGKENCNACGSPDGAILEQKDLVWADENKLFHTSDECVKFEGKWTLISLNDAVAAGYECCPDCEADLFAIAEGPRGGEAKANATGPAVSWPQGMTEADRPSPWPRPR